MTALTINDLGAMVIIIMGIVNIVLSLKKLSRCDHRDRWQYGLAALAGLSVSGSFLYALIDSLNGGTGLVPPEIGRPAVILYMSAFTVHLIVTYRRGDC